jgi:cobalt-precorrin 5A hydrolase/precorrin-3B C17-methyltransferase
VVVGIGCDRGTGTAEVSALVMQALARADVAPTYIAAVASIDLKSDEPAILEVAHALGVPTQFFAAARLEQETPRLANPSELVFRETGCHGVAEGAALAAAGENGVLILPKQRSARATCALARKARP